MEFYMHLKRRVEERQPERERGENERAGTVEWVYFLKLPLSLVSAKIVWSGH